MIDQIKNKIASNVKSASADVKKANVDTAQIKAARVKPTKQEVKTSNEKITRFVSKERIKEMAKEPPIDKVSTTRIKNAIANGSYPIDLNKIADALFDAYKEMKD